MLFRIWLALGAQSFGGGTATFTLVRQAAVDRWGWVSAEEFTRTWGLCQLAPGINLLALTILLGRRAAGTRGVILGLIGLLLPSAALTVLLTAGYAAVHHQPVVRAALRGLVPGTVGLGILSAYDIARPLAIAARGIGRAEILFCGLLLGAAPWAVARWHAPVAAVLVGIGGLDALWSWARASGSEAPAP